MAGETRAVLGGSSENRLDKGAGLLPCLCWSVWSLVLDARSEGRFLADGNRRGASLLGHEGASLISRASRPLRSDGGEVARGSRFGAPYPRMGQDL